MMDLIIKSIKYDPIDGSFTWADPSKYHNNLLGKKCGVWVTANSKRYLVIKIGSKKYRAHRLAWMITYGELPNVIDHIDGDTTNNRISNLRNVDLLANAQNHLKHKKDFSTKRSGLPVGVKSLPSGRFLSRISVRKKLISLGVFNTPEEAHKKYMEERIKSHDCPTIKNI